MSRRPKRRKKTAASRLRPFGFALFVLAAVLSVSAYYAGTWPGFYPKAIRISGNRTVDAREITAQAHIAMHANVWLQNMGAAAARVRAIPYIDRVWIHRSLPAGVRIVVTERSPAAVVQTKTVTVLVDGTLRVLGDAPGDSPLPVLLADARVPQAGGFISDAHVRQLREDYLRLADAHVIVRSLRFDKFGDLVAVMPGGVKLLLGEDADLPQKSALIAPILSQVAAGGRRIAALDLRAPKTPVVQYR